MNQPGNGVLMGHWLQFPTDEPSAPAPRVHSLNRIASLTLVGSSATLAIALLKLVYYWPILEANACVQFTCLH